MGDLRIDSPWSIQVSKKKRFSPNLNQYRNAHHYTLSKAKRMYSEIVREQLPLVRPRFSKVTVTLIVYPPTKRRIDPDNVIIHCKFVMDAIVDEHIIEDDSFEFVKNTQIRFGEIDKNNPRVEIIIMESTDE